MDFQDFLASNIFMGGWGKKWCNVDPQRTRFYFWGSYVSANLTILVKIDQEMRPWKCYDAQTLISQTADQQPIKSI